MMMMMMMTDSFLVTRPSCIQCIAVKCADVILGLGLSMSLSRKFDPEMLTRSRTHSLKDFKDQGL